MQPQNRSVSSSDIHTYARIASDDSGASIAKRRSIILSISKVAPVMSVASAYTSAHITPTSGGRLHAGQGSHFSKGRRADHD